MSEPVTVQALGPQGMVSLRANIGHDRTLAALKGVMGLDAPERRGVVTGPEGAVAWMAPDEWLIVCAHDRAAEVAAGFTAKLHDRHHLAVDLSAARAMFEVTGPGGAVRDVLAALTPADMARGALAPLEMRRTRMAQVAAAIWFEEEDRARVICFRSVAGYVEGLLRAAAEEGSVVGFH